VKTYTFVYFGSAFLVLFITPVVVRLARAMRLVDLPGVRKVHASAIPRIGGVAIVVGMLSLTIPVLALDNVIGQAFRTVQTQIIVLLAAAVFMFTVGFLDDVRDLRARTKLLAQIIAAAVICGFAARIDSITITEGLTVDFGWLAWPITIFWIIGMTNAVNLIDGLDGLAAGISAVACGTIAVLALYAGEQVMAVLMLALLGSLTGFLFFNFNPAKIFMGDCGTMFIGFMLGASSVVCYSKWATLVGLALPFLALGLPIFDTFFSILRRVLERRSIFASDRGHVHHRLLEMGLGHRYVVIIMYLVTLLAAGLGMLMMITRDAGAIAVFACVVLLLLVVFRIIGAVRLKDSIAVLHRNLALAREAKQEKRNFEDAQLRIREANSFDAWWEVVCSLAEQMEFAWVALSVQNGDGSKSTSVWRKPGQEPDLDRVVTVKLPAGQSRDQARMSIELAIEGNGSLETAGRRAALFGRLLDDQHRPDIVLDAGPDHQSRWGAFPAAKLAKNEAGH